MSGDDKLHMSINSPNDSRSSGSGKIQPRLSNPPSPDAESPDPEQRKLAVYKAVFDKFDENKNGMIESCELKDVMAELGWGDNEQAVERALGILDANNNGTIEIDEFLKFGHYGRKQRILKKHGSFEELISKNKPPPPTSSHKNLLESCQEEK